jgi:hypothetical protein
MVVRGSEYDLPPDMLDGIVARSTSDYGVLLQTRKEIDYDDNA